MRIAHVITRMIVGGAQENTLFTCRDLMELHGDEVLLVTGPALGPEGDLIGQGRAGELPVEVVPSLQRAIHPVRDARAYFGIKRALKTFQPKVVHTHSAKGGVLGRMAATALRIPAVVHTVHGAPFYPYQPWAARTLYRACEKYAAKKCHAMISVADAMTDLMVDARMAPRDKFKTIYSGMDVDPFLAADDRREETRRELGFADSDMVVGKIARLFELKGHEYVIAATSQIVQRCPRVRFMFVGDGLLRRQFESQIAAANLSDHFVFTGLVPPDRIPALVGAMDILVHASLREGLARALPQGLIAGKPVVSYDVDGAREVVINDETGFLLPPQSVDELADAIVRLAEDESLRVRLGSEGRERFAEQFRHQYMTARIRELYEELLGR